ncbi:MAG TPA: molecular chaperone DnaJ [bacterium]|nr:molecular chaperone DnaJ [bacterium]
MARPDYYEILGVPRTATQEEIKRAFRQLARAHHPDVNQDPRADERFKLINEAYQVLGDAERRAQYDHGGVNGGTFAPFGGTPFDDIFDMFFGQSRAREGSQGPERGSDLRATLKITLEEAARGAEKPMTITREETCAACFGTGAEKGSAPEPCSACKGTGQVRYSRRTPFGQFAQIATCPHCHGTGRVVRRPCRECRGTGRALMQREITVEVPAGVDDGTRLRLHGEGEAGMRGGGRGDLYVDLSILPHAVFTREGHDLHCQISISMAQAALGAEIEVPTLDGPAPLTVPPGVQPGAVLALKARGMPGIHGGRGDLVVHTTVTIPEALTKEQVKLLAQFAKLRGEQIKPARRSLLEKMRAYLV